MRRVLVVSLVTIFTMMACGRMQNGPGNPMNPGVVTVDSTLTSIQANIFTPRCAIAPCHLAGGIAPFRLDNKGQSFTSLVGVQSLHNPNKSRIAANNAANSYLLDIVQGNGVNGAVMPPGGNNLLTASQVQQIINWINTGAPNN